MTLRRTALLALLPFALAGCDSKMFSNLPGFGKQEAPAAAVPAAPAGPRAPAVSPLEVPIEIEGQRTSLGTANAAFVDVTNFSASGQGWVAAVRGNNAAIRRPGAKDAQVNVRRVDFGQGAEFVGTYAERTASINLRAGDCRDATGATWPMSATLRLGTTKLAGCAAPSGSEPKGFAAASLPVPRAVAAAAPVKKAAPKKVAPKKPAVTPATPPATPTAPTTTPTPVEPATTAPTPTAPATTPTAPAATTPAATPTPPAASAPAATAPKATPPAPTTPPAPAVSTPATTPAPATGSSTTFPVVIPPAK